MAIAERRVHATWEGNLSRGKGKITGASGAFQDFDVTWASRTERSDGMTSPEELIAAAHASCYSMQLSNELDEAGTPPERLDVDAVATLDDTEAGLKMTSMDLTVRGVVPGVDQSEFEKAAQAAKEGCPVSKALWGNVEITLEAKLEQDEIPMSE